MNNFSFTGNLGSDAEVAALPSGMMICSFNVAVNAGFGDKKKTTWVKCGLFGKRAEGELPRYLTKGAQVAVTGEMFLDEWQDKNGGTRATVKVNVDKIDLIGNRQEASPMAQGRAAPAAVKEESFDDAIPF